MALVDLQIIVWRFVFRRCIWRRNKDRDWIKLPCDCGQFWNHGDARRFQENAPAAVRKLANKMLEEPAQ
jgi:hypothetical protein